MPLNQQQQNVAQADRALPLKVVAGAGTGKTETLAARFVEFVRQGVPPDMILLLTFTEEAAAEMRERVTRRLAEAEPDLPTYLTLDLWCHTFHGFAMRLLRQYGWLVSLPPTPRVLEDDEQQTMLDELVTSWEDTTLQVAEYQPFEHASYSWEDGAAWSKARAVLASLRGSGATTEELEPHPMLQLQQESRFGAHRAQLVPLIMHAFDAYSVRLGQAGMLDHDELIIAVGRLLDRMPELAGRFAVIMVDEFQDTNRAQLDLLRRLSHDWSRVTVVGNPRQAIYGWRAARPDSLRLFPYLPNRAHLDQALQQNYRSTPAICTLANLALHRSEFAVEAPLEAARPAGGEMRTPGEAEVALHLVPRIEDEATLVASEMARLIAQGAAPTTIALLLRQRTHLPVFAAALEAAGVPYTVGGGSGFFRQPAVRLVGSLMQLLRDSEDRAAAAHVLESPLVGLDLGALTPYADTRLVPSYPWWQWLHDPTAALPDDLSGREAVAQRLAAFRSFYAAAREHMLVLAPCDLLVWLAGASGLSQWWRTSRNHQAARDFDKLVGMAVQWTALAPGLTLDSFTERLRQRIEAQPREAVPVEYAADAVEITTVHGAKGREWPVVFVADTALPSARSAQVEHVLWDEQWKLVISDGGGGSKRGAPDPLQDLRRDLRRRKRNEERAVWYVALTRARDRLIVTHSRCEVDAGAHFADARAKLSQPYDPQDDDAVHFFHELWELVRTDDQLGETVWWGPGPCSGAETTLLEGNPLQHVAPPSQVSPYLRGAWERAVGGVSRAMPDIHADDQFWQETDDWPSDPG